MFSNEGEIRLVMKDGVEYVLRFGGIAGMGASKKDEKSKDKDKGGGLNRYLFIMVEFNPELIPKPDLEKLPPVKKDAEEKKSKDKKAEEKKKAETAERERIEKENKRKQDEYNQKIADGKKRVEELNARFADWYYVISDEVYHKIHLGHDEIYRKKAKEQDKAKTGQDSGNAMPAPSQAELLEMLKRQGPGGK